MRHGLQHHHGEGVLKGGVHQHVGGAVGRVHAFERPQEMHAPGHAQRLRAGLETPGCPQGCPPRPAHVWRQSRQCLQQAVQPLAGVVVGHEQQQPVLRQAQRLACRRLVHAGARQRDAWRHHRQQRRGMGIGLQHLGAQVV
jgi:hypothetical protein